MDLKPTTYPIRNVKHIAKVVDFCEVSSKTRNVAPKHELKHLILVKLITKKDPLLQKNSKAKTYEV